MNYITTAATTTVGRTRGIRVSINKALTGTLTIADGGTTVAVIAAATAAQDKIYWGFNGSVTVVNGSTEDVTISALSHEH